MGANYQHFITERDKNKSIKCKRNINKRKLNLMLIVNANDVEKKFNNQYC